MCVVRLHEKHKRLLSNFDCGNHYLDNFLKSNRAYDNSIGTTYIALEDKANRLIGYYNITAGSLDIPYGSLRMKGGSSIHINCFAVAKDFQKNVEQFIPGTEQKIYTSDMLLADCEERIREIKEQCLGVGFITLGATEEGLNLYERNGFSVAEDEDIIISQTYEETKTTMMYLFLDDA